jgi:lysophospholipase L1-like esterase
MYRVFIPAIVMASIFAGTQVCIAQEAKHEHIEWSDIWIANADMDDRPRILLVGDSIAQGYYLPVETRLSGKANCARFTTSKFLGDPDYLAELTLILDRYKFDVIHVNNGLHGLDYTDNEYKEGLLALLKIIKRHAPKAKLIWGMTTPTRTGESLTVFKSHQNNRIIARNKIAAEIMNQEKIQINNLYKW